MRLDGTKVLVTGTFDGMSKAEVIAALESRGAVIADSVGFDVEVVFAGSDPGAEVDSAMELGVRVADGTALKTALDGPEPPKVVADEAPVAVVVEDERDAPPASVSDNGRSKSAPQKNTPAQKKADAPSDGPRSFDRGARVRIIGGREGVGELGEIFWWGESKFGEGMRAGVTGDDGTKYWVDEEHLAWPDEEIDEAVLEEAKAANEFGRGDRVRVTAGKGAGSEGMIFWWGESKWGNGMRAGVETDDGDKLWVDAENLAAVEDEDGDIPF